jgi:hypothetical protein
MKFLRKNGVGYAFPFTEVLAARPDMVECEMTTEELVAEVNKPSPLPIAETPEAKEPVPEVKVIKERMKGWKKNKQGRWARKPVVEKKTKADKPLVESTVNEVE